jgi:ABC-2 type transport system permease protein
VNLWRLELLRLTRTHRWTILFGVYLFFAVTGPLTAAYFDEIMASFGGDVTIVAPEPRPVDGLAQFISNAGQLGVLALVVVAAGALAVDARPETAAFLRTRVDRARTLLVPRYVVTTAAGVTALVVGTLVTSIVTWSLIGAVPLAAVVLGTAYGAVFIAFAVAVLAAVAGFARTQVGAVFGTLVVLLTLPIVGLVPAVAAWLPSELLGAVLELVEGASATEHVRSLVTTVVATGALLVTAARRLDRREL